LKVSTDRHRNRGGAEPSSEAPASIGLAESSERISAQFNQEFEALQGLL
jgi:hypothetical protein